MANVQTAAMKPPIDARSGNRRWGRVRTRITGSDIIIHLLMALVAFVVLLPIIWIISTSFKGAQEFYTNSASLAFWDAYLKGDARAKSYLQSRALEKSSHGAVKISRR